MMEITGETARMVSRKVAPQTHNAEERHPGSDLRHSFCPHDPRITNGRSETCDPRA